MKNFLLFASILLIQILTYGQNVQCPSIVNLAEMQTQDPARYQRFMDLENFIANQNNPNQRLIDPNGIITIPVVVHVLHRGEAIGSGRNISDAQIQSQIDVLNEDFRRLNADRVNTPAVFVPSAADFGFEFKLACTDPQGYGTNGIVRKLTSKSSFSYSANGNFPDEAGMGIKTGGTTGSLPWPTDKYLNMWVVDFSDSALGYGSFPSDYIDRPNFDGVVIKNTAFGRVGNVTAPFNKGRTASHEVGHWLSLFHIWGDAACGNDFVADTPPQAGPNRNCPAYPHVSGCLGSGTNGDMFMNYMDYSDDACLNIFTGGQRFRGKSIFSPGGPRFSFLDNTFKIQQPTSTIRCIGKVNLTNILCLTPVTWSILSGPATIAGGQNSNTVTLQSTGIGNVSLTAQSGNYVSDIIVAINQDGADPITNINTSYVMLHCNIIRYKWTVEGGEAATNFKWSYRNITQGTSFSVFKNGPANWAGSPIDEGSCDQIEVKVEATNPCNQFTPQSFLFDSDLCPPYIDGSCSYGRTLLASPNPSNANVQLKLVDEPNVIPTNTQPRKIQQVRIVDKMGQIKRTITGNNSETMIINISGLPADIYTILASDGKVWMSKQISKN